MTILTLFANMAPPGTADNLRRDPQIELNCVDIFRAEDTGFRAGRSCSPMESPVRGIAQGRSRRAWTACRSDAVLIEVPYASPVISLAYTFVEGGTEELLRNAYHGKYGVSLIRRQMRIDYGPRRRIP